MKRTITMAGILIAALLGFNSRAEAFVATNFRVAASSAPVIVVAKVRKGREGMRILQVLRKLRGNPGTHIPFNPKIAGFESEMAIGSTYLLLLTAEEKPFKTENMCGTVNALQIEDDMVSNPPGFDPDLKTEDGKPRKILPLSEVENVLRLEKR